MKICSLENTSVKTISKALNAAFAGYYVPLKLSTAELAKKMKIDRNDASLSVGVFDQDHLVAFLLHGKDRINNKLIVYNGGTGVLENYRGKRLTQKMYAHILPQLQTMGADELVLEVLTQNEPALKSYQKIGFEIARKLNGYSGSLSVNSSLPPVTILRADSVDWERLTEARDVDPSWQFSNQALQQMGSELVVLDAFLEKRWAGSVLYNSSKKQVGQIVVHPTFRRQGVASALLNHVAQHYSENCSAINVDAAHQALHALFLRCGLALRFTQFEMKLRF